MAIVSINYSKISAQKSRKPFKGQISIKNNVSINNVAVGDLSATANQKGIVIDFSFSIVYEPSIGVIAIEGSVVDLEEEKAAKEIADMWSKNKRLDKDITTKVISVVLEKCTIKALMLSQDIGLPSPVPMPRLKIESDAKVDISDSGIKNEPKQADLKQDKSQKKDKKK